MRSAIAAIMLVGAAALSGCATRPPPSPASVTGGPRRVILIVGDGMGLAHWSSARIASGEPLAVARLPVIGLVDTRCLCNRVTESAAAATALATGRRTAYRFVGMAPDSTPLPTVLEAAEARGMATGLVTTTQIVDATPAAFAAHVPSRDLRYEIASQMAARDIEVLMGGGRSAFTSRPDGVDLLAALAERSTFVGTVAELRALDLGRTERLVGLFADSTLFPLIELRPTLPEMAEAALAVLDRDPDGFFLLLEQEDTDNAHHDNLPLDSALPAILELDKTVALALDYQARRPETLVVVTGDHETGGVTLFYAEGAPASRYATTGHSSTMVPLFAGGPGSERFGGWLDNDEVGRLLLEAVGARAEVVGR
jgi:alkaline phosphatase